MATLIKKNEPFKENEPKYQRLRWIRTQFDRYETYWATEIDRIVRNARMYWHVNFGQWPQSVVEKLRTQNRRPPTFPVIPDKIETFVGNIIANDLDMKYEPTDGVIDSMTIKLQDMYYSDQSHLDWEVSKIKALLDGAIMVGYERMIIKDAVDDFGNVAWESPDPRHVYLSPSWKNNFVNDIRDYFVWDPKSAEQIIETFPNVSEHVRSQYEREKIEGIDYGYSLGAAPRFRTIEDKWNSLFKVIEFHHVEKIDRMYEYDKKNGCFFPETGFKLGSRGDIQAKAEYAQLMKLSPDDVLWMKQKKTVKYIEAIVPELDQSLFLVNGKDIIQTNNCNIYPIGIRYNGYYQGLVDRMYDTQIGLNKYEMTIQDWQMRMAKGAVLLDKQLAGDDPALMAAIEEGWNDPAARIWVEEGSTAGLANGGMIPFPTVQPTSDMFTQAGRYVDYMDRFSKVSAAQDSRTESSKESGRLYSYKLQVAQTALRYILSFYIQHEKAKAEAYPLQGKITYAGYPRQFARDGGGDPIKINRRMMDNVTGKIIVLDDISKLPLIKVIVRPSKKGYNVRNEMKTQLAEMLEISTKEPKDRLLRLVVQTKIYEMSEGQEEDKEEIVKAGHLLKIDEALDVILRIKQKEMQLQAIMQQQQQQQMKAIMSGTGTQKQLPQPAMAQQASVGEPSEEEAMAGTLQSGNVAQPLPV